MLGRSLGISLGNNDGDLVGAGPLGAAEGLFEEVIDGAVEGVEDFAIVGLADANASLGLGEVEGATLG